MEPNIVILVRQQGLGSFAAADLKFGVEMFDKFLHALESAAVRPRTLCLYTEAVKLASEGSPAVPGLRMIQDLGVRILICGSCIDYYRLQGRIAVGELSNMAEIVRTLTEADKVITI